MTEEFKDWTEYDNWLIKNYAENNIYKVEEKDGKICIEYCTKGTGEFEKILDATEKKSE